MADIEIEIDGQKLSAKPNQTVIQVADDAGIYIPRFCYHQHLTIPANCRMCLVEIEKSPKALPACATPVAPGMKVFTKSQKTLAAQRAVMEFLLINHPLDCPICDQGGECELQDLSMGYGSSWSSYDEPKRSVADQNLGPLIATEMTRCIYCTRCVRFGDEIAGLRELGAIGRGEFTEIGTYIQHAIKSEISGNIIDLCPVGALTNKPYRFTARPWELDQAPAISPHDCVGSNMNIHTRYGKVMRVVARENKAINETWISDRDRFSFTGLYHIDRIKHPMVRVDGEWQFFDWQNAFMQAATGLQTTIAACGADKFGALASPNATLEEFYLLQKLVRALDSPHIDHRLRERDTKDQWAMPLYPGFNMGNVVVEDDTPIHEKQVALPELGECDAILIIGSHLQKEEPLVAVQVRKASLRGASIFVINPVDYQFNFKVDAKKIVAPQLLAKTLAEDLHDFITQMKGKQNICILLGAHALHHPKASTLRYLADKNAKELGARLFLLTDGANSAGGWIAGAVPHRLPGGESLNHNGLNAYEMLEKPRKAYLLLNVEPDLDCANAMQAIKAMHDAKFIVALSQYRNPVLEAHANVILPIAPFTETSGTFINAGGFWQSFKGVAKPYGLSRPAWKVLCVLAKFLLLEGFDFDSSEAVKKEVRAKVTTYTPPEQQIGFSAWQPTDLNTEMPMKLARIGDIPIYAGDSLLRRAKPLQETQAIMEGNVDEVRIHPDTAFEFGLKQGDKAIVKQAHTQEVALNIAIDERVSKAAAFIAGGINATRELGDLIGEVELSKFES